MDSWAIMLAVWLPIGGIIIALCLYSLTELQAEEIRPARDGNGYGSAETPFTHSPNRTANSPAITAASIRLCHSEL